MHPVRTVALIMALACSVPAKAMDPAAALTPFKQALKQTLVTALAQGPASAIDACRLQAPSLAMTHSSDEVQVGRASHRLRNPDNAPTPWVADVINSYLSDPEQRKPVTQMLADGRMGYVEPIMTQGMCLACHGSNLPADVTEQLQRHYPDDRATGFKEGDLRGVFWVTWTP